MLVSPPLDTSNDSHSQFLRVAFFRVRLSAEKSEAELVLVLKGLRTFYYQLLVCSNNSNFSRVIIDSLYRPKHVRALQQPTSRNHFTCHASTFLSTFLFPTLLSFSLFLLKTRSILEFSVFYRCFFASSLLTRTAGGEFVCQVEFVCAFARDGSALTHSGMWDLSDV